MEDPEIIAPTVSITEAARRLGWSREYLYRVLSKHQIEIEIAPIGSPVALFPVALIEMLRQVKKGKPGRKPKSAAPQTEFCEDE